MPCEASPRGERRTPDESGTDRSAATSTTPLGLRYAHRGAATQENEAFLRHVETRRHESRAAWSMPIHPVVSGPVIDAIAAVGLLIDTARFFRPAERAQA